MYYKYYIHAYAFLYFTLRYNYHDYNKKILFSHLFLYFLVVGRRVGRTLKIFLNVYKDTIIFNYGFLSSERATWIKNQF